MWRGGRMKRLVFVDDDREELEAMEQLVVGAYEFVGLHWPRQVPNRVTIGEPTPAIFVSDLYVPSLNGGDEPIYFPPVVLAKQMELAKRTAEEFMQLYPGPTNAKRRMRQTMAALM